MNETKCYISEVVFNNGFSLSVMQNDIVVFVGPNNTGKSQSLKDIYIKCGDDSPTKVITDIKITKEPGSLLPLLNKISIEEDQGKYSSYLVGGGHAIFDHKDGDNDFFKKRNLYVYRDLFISYLSTERRLSVCKEAKNINRKKEIWTNPIHYAAFDSEYGNWLSDSFFKAFGNHITPNVFNGATIPLCIGPQIRLEDHYDKETDRYDAFSKTLEGYESVESQGDGIKSFTGILLYLMLNYYCTYLIDEPESFLHPPQARIMGQIIGHTLSDKQQAFLSTHSEEFLKGLLEACPNRLKIVRITREGNENSISVLDNIMINEVLGDPLLKHSNIMSSLFHKSVVLCESDSDCKFYSIVDGHIKRKNNAYSETLFIHCGGKDRMAKVANALIKLKVDVKLIPDIDVLNDESTISRISKVFGVDWKKLARDYAVLKSNIGNPSLKQRDDIKKELLSVLYNSNEKYLSKAEIKTINSIVRSPSKWDEIKKVGIPAIPPGDATNAFYSINNELKQHNIYIVPVGELEGFVKEVGGHGPSWVNSVLERFPDLDSSVYDSVRSFVSGMDL